MVVVAYRVRLGLRIVRRMEKGRRAERAMRDGDSGGTALDGDGVAIDERALASFVETSERLGGELTLRLAEAQDLDRQVRNASPDGAVPSGVLGELEGLAARWRNAAVTVADIRSGVVAADQGWVPTAVPGGVGPGGWGAQRPMGGWSPMTLGDDEPGDVEILPPSPELGIGIEILPPSPELGIGIEILPPSPELGIGVETLPPSPDLGTGIESFPVDDERILREHASRKRRKPPPTGEPVPTGPVFRPDDPFAPVPVHGKLYPAHQVTFWPTGRTAPGPDGKPQPLYDTKLLGEGAPHVDNNTLIPEDHRRIWHIDVENPDPGGRPGQLHLQYAHRGKQIRHMYDFNTDRFLPSSQGLTLTRKMEREVRADPDFQRALEEARKSLNASTSSPGAR